MEVRLSNEAKFALIKECYEFWKEKIKFEDLPENKAIIYKKYRIVSVYATRNNINRMSDKAFMNIINRFHPNKSIKIKEVIFDMKIEPKSL